MESCWRPIHMDLKHRLRWWVESDDTWSALRIRGLVPDGQQLVFVSSHSMCQHCTVMAGYWSLLFCKMLFSKLNRCIEDEVCCAQNTSILFTNVWIKTFQTTYTDESQQKVKILDWLLALFVCYKSRQVYWCRWWLLCSCPQTWRSNIINQSSRHGFPSSIPKQYDVICWLDPFRNIATVWLVHGICTLM